MWRNAPSNPYVVIPYNSPQCSQTYWSFPNEDLHTNTTNMQDPRKGGRHPNDHRHHDDDNHHHGPSENNGVYGQGGGVRGVGVVGGGGAVGGGE